MKFGQVLEYNNIFFFEHHAENMTERLVPDPFSFFFLNKTLFEVKVCSFVLMYISIILNLAYNKNKLYQKLDYQMLDYWSRDMFWLILTF